MVESSFRQVASETYGTIPGHVKLGNGGRPCAGSQFDALAQHRFLLPLVCRSALLTAFSLFLLGIKPITWTLGRSTEKESQAKQIEQPLNAFRFACTRGDLK